MLGLSGTSSLYLYLCIFICVFVQETLGNISLGPRAFRKCMFVWSKTSYSGDMWRCHHAGRTDEQTRKDNATQPLDAGRRSFAILMIN